MPLPGPWFVTSGRRYRPAHRRSRMPLTPVNAAAIALIAGLLCAVGAWWPGVAVFAVAFVVLAWTAAYLHLAQRAADRRRDNLRR